MVVPWTCSFTSVVVDPGNPHYLFIYSRAHTEVYLHERVYARFKASIPAMFSVTDFSWAVE